MKIHEILARDPRTTPLANNGQARILNRADEHATAELRAELETFVCEGRFSDAMERIIGRYLPDLNNPRQSSVWVSGFFGSGKSHLLKMLTHLWMNTTFGGGSNARNIVSGGLPDEIEDHLRELDTQAKRTGKGLFAAAGTLLGGNERVRATVLSIVLQAGGWPEQYPTAMFCFWLRDRGWLDAVRSAVEESGRDWLRELNNLYVSPYIARALLQVDKDFAPDERSARRRPARRYRGCGGGPCRNGQGRMAQAASDGDRCRDQPPAGRTRRGQGPTGRRCRLCGRAGRCRRDYPGARRGRADDHRDADVKHGQGR